ncbi:MAG: hypothetical protein E7439_05135 [Ruminococcaceae bacterium]|nr:hypothetical protein [Oscillospiraceae bacterium]
MRFNKPLSGASFGILGDSYSTFRGYIPQGNSAYYPYKDVDDVLEVEHTWWHQLMTRHGLTLTVNDSYSGATVCTNTREGQPFSSAFTERAKRSFSGENQPDYIFLFGCTNDSWLERSIGEPKFEGRTEEDLMQVLPAYCFCLEYLTTHNPNATVVAVVNTGLHEEIHAGMVCAAKHYGATIVELADIDKQHGHPSALGMRQIVAQIEDVLL